MKLKMKIPTVILKLLTNKYVLYFISFLALINIIGYVMVGKINIAILFLLIGYIASFFSKNMVIILLVPLIFVSLIMSGHVMKEGFANKLAEQSSLNPGKPKQKDNNIVDIEDVDAVSRMEIPIPSILPGGNVGSSDQGEQELMIGSTYHYDNLPINPDTDIVGESFEVGKKKSGTRVDYGSTIEQAYDDLNNVLGGEGIQKLTQDTERLMKQQLQLANAMKGMGPLLQQAQTMMKGLNIDGLDLGGLVKQLGLNKNNIAASNQ